MAREVILRKTLKEYEQDEIVDIQQVANPDTGVVEEVVTVLQEHCYYKIELTVTQETFPAENRSDFYCEVWAHIKSAGDYGDGISISFRASDDVVDGTGHNGMRINEYIGYMGQYSSPTTTLVLNNGESTSQLLSYLYTNNNTKVLYSFNTGDDRDRVTLKDKRFMVYHSFDGTCPFIKITGNTGLSINNLIRESTTSTSLSGGVSFEEVLPCLSIDRGSLPITASNFTDEENPSFTYSLPPNTVYVKKYAVGYDENYNGYFAYLNYDYIYYDYQDTVTGAQAALSFDGVTADIAYRNIPIDGSNYTFNLTDEEREILRVKAQGSNNVPIYYLIKTDREYDAGKYGAASDTFTSATQRIITIVGCNPQLNPTVKDIKPETLALTGDENTFVRYESMAEYAINATASKNATIVSQSVQCGSKVISNLPYGVIDDVESGTFIFNVVDSRNMGASSSVFKNLVEYVKPTCYQKVGIEITGETGAIIKATISGNYFNGSFGAADNTLQLQVRYGENVDNMGDWITLNGTPTFNGNTYELEATFNNFNYGSAYIFQSRAIDKLNTVESSQYTIRMLPVFDWSETDFNFNVPVNIDAEDLSMHGETIIRHSDTTNNTVLSATGGHIYIRPNGSNSTSNQTILYSSGNVSVSGDITVNGGATFGDTVNFGNSFSIDGNYLADYVIATGEEAMGSNGTWYWRKWASGKSEAWGCRNFGNMAVNTTWGNLYRSAVLTQDLPDNVFIRTPDSININIVHATFGGWICKHEQTAPSAVTTGSFIFVRPASATVTAPTNIGFYVVGEWQ